MWLASLAAQISAPAERELSESLDKLCTLPDMNSVRQALDEIQEINLSYLLLAQRLLREDVAIGMFRLGVSAEVAEILVRLTVQQVGRIAGCGQMLCQFRFASPEILASLARKRPARNMETMHAAILLAGMPVEKLA